LICCLILVAIVVVVLLRRKNNSSAVELQAAVELTAARMISQQTGEPLNSVYQSIRTSQRFSPDPDNINNNLNNNNNINNNMRTSQQNAFGRVSFNSPGPILMPGQLSSTNSLNKSQSNSMMVGGGRNSSMMMPPGQINPTQLVRESEIGKGKKKETDVLIYVMFFFSP